MPRLPGPQHASSYPSGEHFTGETMEAARGSNSRLGFKRKPNPNSPVTEGRVCDT